MTQIGPLQRMPQIDPEVYAQLPPDLREKVDEITRAFAEGRKALAETGRWFHATPYRLPVGTRLTPGGGEPSEFSRDFYATTEGINEVSFAQDSGTLAEMGAGRAEWVWLTTNVGEAEFWAAAIGAKLPRRGRKIRHHRVRIYEVAPETDPLPWNGTGTDGWVTTAAVIVTEVRR